MTARNAPRLFGIILAGGSGTRFWPLSRSQYPKQVLRLLGSQSLLQATCNRVLPRIPAERLAVVSSAAQADVIRLDLHRQGLTNIHLWLEPEGRNTAPAVALAASLMGPGHEMDIMAVFPADHYIQDTEAFHQALEQAALLAQAGYLVTFGITPSRPDTGYGYIKAGEPLPAGGLKALAFAEKPSLARAQAFLKEGGYYWNSGMFLFRRDVFLEALARHLPELQKGIQGLSPGVSPEALAETYRHLPTISLDHGIMEKADNVAVVPVNFGWSDVGTWSALHDLVGADDRGNVILGRVLDLGSRDSLIFAQDRLVGTIGLTNMIVVDTADATLVCPRDRVQDVKDLVAEITRQNQVESREHLTVERPWGRYTVMQGGPGYKVKKVVVAPGCRLSLQLHHRRAEHWVVVQGVAQVTIGDQASQILPNQSVYIPLETAHRLENPGTEPLVLIEVQTGDYLEEDDIVRLADDFWRGPTK
jgi:mannose-1-phosphate guanylyltransferase/mannose-6-phosphate isomerase|uniref:mannose-1-phosphate guanylyltransferase n=1 Tax=Desulfobacca acetoxidans TaxID=60893 RepID=A0A7V6DP02_9BACT